MNNNTQIKQMQMPQGYIGYLLTESNIRPGDIGDITEVYENAQGQDVTKMNSDGIIGLLKNPNINMYAIRYRDNHTERIVSVAIAEKTRGNNSTIGTLLSVATLTGLENKKLEYINHPLMESRRINHNGLGLSEIAAYSVLEHINKNFLESKQNYTNQRQRQPSIH